MRPCNETAAASKRTAKPSLPSAISGRNVILSHERAHDLCLRAFTNRGMPADEARKIADVLVEAEMWGKPTHGLNRAPGLMERYLTKSLKPVQVVKEGPAYLHFDAGSHFGYVALRMALDEAMERATRSGVCVVGIRNSDHCGIAGYYAWLAARNGFLAALTCDCFARTAPFGATTPVFGTDPIAFGLPTDQEPVVLDFSISEMTNGLMNALIRERGCLPDGIAFDRVGRPTTDPAEGLAGAVKAFGGHKGSGIAIVAHLLCTAFVGATVLPSVGVDYGYFMAVAKPDLFVSTDEFRGRSRALLSAVKAARPEDGRGEVMLPGESSWRSRQRALERGIDVPAVVVAKLKEMAGDA